MGSDYLDQPLSKIKKQDRELLQRAITAVENKEPAMLRGILSSLVERNLLNYRKAFPMECTLLNMAVSSRDLVVAEILVNAGASLDVGDFRRTTPLMKAATYDLELTERMLSLGAGVNVQDSMGLSPLHWAAGSVFAEDEILCVLIRAGADVNARENAGRTPLHSAVGIISPLKVEILLKSGADKSIQANGTLGNPIDYLIRTVRDLPTTTLADRQECVRLLSG